jgi:hypothetical protein
MKEHLNAIILAVAILLAGVIYCLGTRYQAVGAGKGVAFQVNRITGSTWYLVGPHIFPMKEAPLKGNHPGNLESEKRNL